MTQEPWFVVALTGGLGNLAAYLAAHVLLCLLPAFFIAGAMSALIPKPTVTRLLGRSASRWISYPGAAMAGSLLAVCSCTIVPLFAGIYRKGAGIGPAITFLFFAPASNVLALIYTGGILGADLAIARLLLSLAFGIGIGLLMALLFSVDDEARERVPDTLFAADAGAGLAPGAGAFLLVWVALLVAGTLKVDVLTGVWSRVEVPLGGLEQLQATLDRWVPHDTARGEEGVTVHGAILIGLLAVLGVVARRGLDRVQDEFTVWTRAAVGLAALTLLVAALDVRTGPNGLAVGITGRFAVLAAGFLALAAIARARLGDDDVRAWLWESWRFFRQVFPLLVGGVFVVGVARQFIRPEWVESLAGSNTPLGNLAGVAFGVVMYFPTLVEVPVARMFLDFGMHRGPLLAYLMADPELSLQSILVISAVIGRRKTWTYVGWVALFSATAGYAYGSWVDGVSAWRIGVVLALFLTVLAGAVGRVARRLPASRPA